MDCLVFSLACFRRFVDSGVWIISSSSELEIYVADLERFERSQDQRNGRLDQK